MLCTLLHWYVISSCCCCCWNKFNSIKFNCSGLPLPVYTLVVFLCLTVCILRCLYIFVLSFVPSFLVFPPSSIAVCVQASCCHIFHYQCWGSALSLCSIYCISHVLLVDDIQRNVRFALILRLVSLCYFCQFELLYWFLLFDLFILILNLVTTRLWSELQSAPGYVPCCLISCFDISDLLICQFDVLCYHLEASMYVLRTFSVQTRYLW